VTTSCHADEPIRAALYRGELLSAAYRAWGKLGKLPSLTSGGGHMLQAKPLFRLATGSLQVMYVREGMGLAEGSFLYRASSPKQKSSSLRLEIAGHKHRVNRVDEAV